LRRRPFSIPLPRKFLPCITKRRHSPADMARVSVLKDPGATRLIGFVASISQGLQKVVSLGVHTPSRANS
jgi:hypothetical protein